MITYLDRDSFYPLELALGHHFSDLRLLDLALTHKSYRNENRQSVSDDNEKLEFLGDAVLDLLLSEALMVTYPDNSEGQLSKKRASLVNEASLESIARELEVSKFLKLGKGEFQSGGADKPRLLASTFEAIVGALFQDAGFEVTRKIVFRIFEGRIKSLADAIDFEMDYKTRYQEIIQRSQKITPTYQTLGTLGPEHDKSFQVEVLVGEGRVAVGIGRSKKQAEQDAAKRALEALI